MFEQGIGKIVQTFSGPDESPTHDDRSASTNSVKEFSICGLDADLMAFCESEIGNDELIAMIDQMCKDPPAVEPRTFGSLAIQKETTNLKPSATMCGTFSPTSCSTASSWHASPASIDNMPLLERPDQRSALLAECSREDNTKQWSGLGGTASHPKSDEIRTGSLVADHDPALSEAIASACVDIREQMAKTIKFNEERVVKLQCELQRLRENCADQQREYDMLVDQMQSADQVKADKLEEPKAAEASLRSELENERSACDDIRARINTKAQEIQNRVSAMKKEMFELSMLQSSLTDELQACSDHQRQLELELEKERQPTWRQSADVANSIMSTLQNAPPTLAALQTSMNAVVQADCGKKDSLPEDQTSSSLKHDSCEGTQDTEPMQKMQTWHMNSKLDTCVEDVTRSLSIGNGFQSVASSTRAENLDFELAECESALHEIETRAQLSGVDPSVRENCLQLSLRLEALAGDALECGCSRDVPGAMDVFGAANNGIEKLVSVMQGYCGAGEDRMPSCNESLYLAELHQQISDELAKNASSEAYLTELLSRGARLAPRLRLHCILPDHSGVIMHGLQDLEAPAVEESMKQAELGIECIERGEANRFQMDVQISRLKTQLGADQTELLRLCTRVRDLFEEEHAHEEVLAQSHACLSALRRDICREEALLTEEVRASHHRSEYASAELQELKIELSNCCTETRELARHFMPRRLACCSRRRQYASPRALASCNGVPPVASVIAYEHI